MKQHQGAAPRGPARAPARRPARAPRRVRRGRPRRPPASAAPRASLRAAHAQHDVQDTKSQPATGAPQAGATVLLDSVAPAGARCTVCACWASTQQQQLWRLHAASRPRPPHSRVPAWPAGCRGEVPQAARARAGGPPPAPPPPPPPPPPSPFVPRGCMADQAAAGRAHQRPRPGARRQQHQAAGQTRRWRAARTGAQAARVRRHGLRHGGDCGLARLRAARGAQHRAERAQRLLLRRARGSVACVISGLV